MWNRWFHWHDNYPLSLRTSTPLQTEGGAAMSKKRWFRLYIERWRDGTFGLSPNEIAAYITLLCELYDHDGMVIRPDFDIMARRCGMRPTSFRKAFDDLVRCRKLAFEGDVLTSKAVSEEIESREKLGEKSVKSREKVGGKMKEINGFHAKIPPYKEDRIQKERKKLTGEGSALLPNEQALEEANLESLPPHLAGFYKRLAMRSRRLR